MDKIYKMRKRTKTALSCLAREIFIVLYFPLKASDASEKQARTPSEPLQNMIKISLIAYLENVSFQPSWVGLLTLKIVHILIANIYIANKLIHLHLHLHQQSLLTVFSFESYLYMNYVFLTCNKKKYGKTIYHT